LYIYFITLLSRKINIKDKVFKFLILLWPHNSKQTGQCYDKKTEICLCSRHDEQPIKIRVNGELVNSSDTIKVLSVLFDSRMQWSKHVQSAIKKSARALNAIKLIRKYFTAKELIRLITSNFYSVLFYNSEIWHLNSLKQRDKTL
jgi:hypothetical protein